MLDGMARRSRLTVSTGRTVAAFLVAGMVVMVAIGVVLAVAQKRAAVREAVRDACTLTNLEAHDVVGPALTSAALQPGPEFDALDQVVRKRVLGDLIVRVKIWDETGTIRYSDDPALIGKQFTLADDELAALQAPGRLSAEVTDLDEAENQEERQFGKLLQVYLGVQTSTGQKLLFETYQSYDSIDEASRRIWFTNLPVLVAGLLVLYVIQAPLAYGMATRLKRAQEQREQYLLATLAAADRERTRIASDLHDGIVQEMAGSSWSLSADAGRSQDPVSAELLDRTAVDLRRWVRELRSLIVTVTPPALHRQGLAASLRDLVSVLEGRGVRVEVAAEEALGLTAATEILAYRVTQEAVRNIVRHAEATEVRIVAAVRSRQLVLSVADDGRGFDPAVDHRDKGSVGLELLTAVVASHGGALDVVSRPGHGTTLTLHLPVGLEERAAPEPEPEPVR
jgi:signal transduction histidine kinase